MKEVVTGPRNSRLRKIFDPVISFGAHTLLKVKPDITADQVTYAGLGLTVIGSFTKFIPKIPEQFATPVALALISLGISFDALDGYIARLKNTSSIHGALTDIESDRIGESTMAISRIISASMRKDIFGVVTATVSGITGPLPSYKKAQVEALDSVVSESGLGTRPVRVLVGTAGVVFPEFPLGPFKLQPVADFSSSVANIFTTYERAKILEMAKKRKLDKKNDPEMQTLGRLKTEWLREFIKYNSLTMITAGMIGIGISLK